MSLEKETYIFDIGNWRGKPLPDVIVDASSGIIEASAASFLDRVNPTVVKLSGFARFSNEKSQDPAIIASTQIHTWAQNNDSKGIEIWLHSKKPTENEILEAIKPFSDFNPGKLMIWFSPRNDSAYKEGTRIGIYQVIYVNNEKYLFFRTLCNYDYCSECAKSATKLLAFSSLKENPIIFTDPEILRATPLPLETTGGSISEFFSHYLHFPSNFWEALAQGKDLSEKIKINSNVARVFTPEILDEISRADTFTDQRRIGEWLEIQLQEQTQRTLKGGVCGILYSSTEKSNSLSKILGIKGSENGRRRHCGRCGKHGYFTEGESCPYDSSS